MIANILINLLTGIIVFLVSLFPSYSSIDPNINAAITKVFSGLNFVNAFLPIATVFTILTLMFTIDGILLLMRLINWAYNKIRGSG